MIEKPKSRRSPRKYLDDDGVYRLPDGKEVCDLTSKKGRDEYELRKSQMHERQALICCLYGHCPTCPGRLRRAEAMFEHEDGRGAGRQDDRTEKTVKGVTVWINGVAHPYCNSWKGSRRIPYNEMKLYLCGKKD
jgi:hypothetical protein